LNATLLESLANDRVRLACLRGYLKNMARSLFKTLAGNIRRLSLQLQQKPRIRELQRLPLPPGTQNLVWLDGEALCLTPAFREHLGDQIPDWLRFGAATPGSVEQ